MSKTVKTKISKLGMAWTMVSTVIDKAAESLGLDDDEISKVFYKEVENRVQGVFPNKQLIHKLVIEVKNQRAPIITIKIFQASSDLDFVKIEFHWEWDNLPNNCREHMIMKNTYTETR